MHAQKIAIVLPDLRVGGAEILHIDLARQFRERGFDVEFVLLQRSGELLESVMDEFSVVGLGVNRYRVLLDSVRRYLLAASPVLTIAPMWPLTAIVPLAVKMTGRGKVMVSEHNTLSNQYRDYGVIHRALLKASTGIGYRFADVRVGVSAGVVSDMSRLSGVRESRFDLIYNPVRSGVVPGSDAVKFAERQWPRRGRRVLSVGSLKSQKNHALLIEAWTRIDADLVIVGDGPECENLRRLTCDLSLSDRVVFVGRQLEPSAFYSTADLFVLSSDYEGFGNVLVEALSFGLPVVSTDCPSGPAEILENGKWGRLVPVGDAEALARAIEEALVAPVDRDALKRRAADFSPEIAARKYLDALGLA